jgi:two-component system, NarL family, nitrate/nitrite response regulator NarL
MNGIKQKIKVMLVDDHPMVLEGIKSFLSSRENIEVIGEAMDGEEAISKVKILAPDIILMDISMPTINGIETTRIIRDIDPTVKVIILTMHDDVEYVQQFAESGARGYLLKKTSPAELIRAIESVYHGEAFFSPHVSNTILREYQKLNQPKRNTIGVMLSDREFQVLRMIGDGMNSRQIAEKLYTSDRTIEKFRERIMEKLNIHTTAGLIKYALENNIDKVD